LTATGGSQCERRQRRTDRRQASPSPAGSSPAPGWVARGPAWSTQGLGDQGPGSILANPVQLKGGEQFTGSTGRAPNTLKSRAPMQYMRDNYWKMMALRAALGTGASGGIHDQRRQQDRPAGKNGHQSCKTHSHWACTSILDWHSGSCPTRNRNKPRPSLSSPPRWPKNTAPAPTVIYEDFNEAGPVVTWAQKSSRYHTAVVAAIRAVDSRQSHHHGPPPNWSQDVDKAAADPVSGNETLLYTLHFYSPFHRLHRVYHSYPLPPPEQRDP